MIRCESGWNPAPGHPEWPDGEVHIWRATLTLPADFIAGVERILSTDEQARARRYRFDDDRRRYLGGRGLVRVLLGRYLHIAPDQVRFDYTRFGKPHLAPGLTPRSLQFNVSHSGELLLIAVAGGRALGVDVEQIRPDIDVEAIAARFFSSNEQAALERLPQPARVNAFFDCWTRKEAYIKAKGEGLSLPLDRFDVALMPGETARLIETRPDPAEARRWCLASLDVADGYRAALAVEGDGCALKCWDWKPEHDGLLT